MTLSDAIIKRINDLMHIKNIENPYQLALKCGNEAKNISFEELEILTDALDCSISDLIKKESKRLK